MSKANLLNNQFVSVFTCEDLSHIPKMSENQVPDIADVDIQIEGDTKLLQELDSHNAIGADSIPGNLLLYKLLLFLLLYLKLLLSRVNYQMT